MAPTQHLPSSLTALDVALAALLQCIKPLAPTEVPLAEALGCVAAETPPVGLLPPRDVAVRDGWALNSRDLVGASSYSPLALSAPPAWVEAGDPMPDDCDCVLDDDSVDRSGPIHQVLTDAVPGRGVRRTGEDLGGGVCAIAAGRIITARNLLVARGGGLQRLSVRRPRLRIVNMPAGSDVTAQLISENAQAAGAEIRCIEAKGRDTASIASAFEGDAGDLTVTIGGTGPGRTDSAISAIESCGQIFAHGIALEPGRTGAVGRVGAVPVVALPGAPDQALGPWWTLALPALDKLSGRSRRPTETLPLSRKIAAQVGLAEIVLLEKARGHWIPLAVGDLSLGAIAGADAFLVVPAGSEGFAAGAPVDAYMLRD